MIPREMEEERLMYLKYLYQEGYIDKHSYDIFRQDTMEVLQDPHKSYITYVAMTKGEQKRKMVKTPITLKQAQVSKQEYQQIQEISKVYRQLRNASEGEQEEVQSQLIAKNCRYIQYIPNPSERLKEEAVIRCKKGISYIKNPSDTLCQKAIDLYGEEVKKYIQEKGEDRLC